MAPHRSPGVAVPHAAGSRDYAGAQDGGVAVLDPYPPGGHLRSLHSKIWLCMRHQAPRDSPLFLLL